MSIINATGSRSVTDVLSTIGLAANRWFFSEFSVETARWQLEVGQKVGLHDMDEPVHST
jgi:hypothetical protein